ncbi:restin homolog [Anopheles aquasalis]|uniref:restin homolog n=1 Tax=Anopheles aquasalis TaxID=42839 RepID=UPI00215B6850|nr:restin homolog [Anopheles aquasalis]
MSKRICAANDDVTQSGSAIEPTKNERSIPSAQTWHQMLLHPSPSSSQLSYGSEATQNDAGSASSTPRPTVRHGSNAFTELDDSGCNYDSGNFSLSDTSVKGKQAFAVPVDGDAGSSELHHRFVQLNTELYQAKTELLTYKYKWNEIRNEIGLSWSKKLDKLVEEKNELVKELDELSKELARMKQGDTSNRELHRLRSELTDVTVQFECKKQANKDLVLKIAEQYGENENLSTKLVRLEGMLADGRSELLRTKESEAWFREGLHRCQNENAKLKAALSATADRMYTERAESEIRLCAAREECKNAIIKQESKDISSCAGCSEVQQLREECSKEIASLKETADRRMADLSASNLRLEKENDDLHTLIEQLNRSLADHQQQLMKCAKNEKETRQGLLRLMDNESGSQSSDRDTRRRHESEIATLSAQLARECITKRQIEVGVEQLKAQVKVLSINFVSTCQRLAVQECELKSLRTRNSELEQRLTSNQLPVTMWTAKEENELLENFRVIQSKNCNLELKLGQCVNDTQSGSGATGFNPQLVRHSEAIITLLKQNITELEQKLTPRDSNASAHQLESSSKMSCPKHGSSCHANAEIDEANMRDLRTMLKAIESDNQRRLQRYEINNRTLLKKIKECVRERERCEQRFAELEKQHAQCGQLRCEMASQRERCLLLEADLESSQQEATMLRAGKERLVTLLQNNCRLMANGDVWASLKLTFKELHELQQVHKENERLREQVEIDAKKMAQLEAASCDWKLAAEVQSTDADELRSELAVKNLQLEDSRRTVERLVDENRSLQQSATMVAANESSFTQQLDELTRLVRIQEIRLETAHERLKLYEDSERILAASKERFFHDLQSLQDAILQEKREKYELQEEVRELRRNMVNVVGNSLQNINQTQCSNSGSGQRSTAITSPDLKSFSPSSLDIDQLQALVEESSRKSCTLKPLKECVFSLKQEMNNLKAVILSDQQPHRPNQLHDARFPLSLMEELNDAANGFYGSR